MERALFLYVYRTGAVSAVPFLTASRKPWKLGLRSAMV